MGLNGDRAVWEAEDFGVTLLDLTIGDLLDERAEEFPDREALVYNYPEIELNLRLTFRQYREEADRLARALIAIGVEKGENVGVWAPNLPEWVMLELALAKIGAVLVTINTSYKTAELEYVLRQGDITHLFMAHEHRGNSYVDSIYALVPELRSMTDPLDQSLFSVALPSLRTVVLLSGSDSPGLVRYADLLERAEEVGGEDLRSRQSGVRPDDIAQMQYTSGTTGFPKAVMLTHNNLINQSHVCTLRGGLTSEERQVTAMPFFHVAGCVGGVIFSLYLGATLIPVISFDPAKELELFDSEKATMSFNVPTMLIAMLHHPRFINGEFDLSTLRLITTGATPVPVALMEEVKAKMGAECSIVYGMTESSGAVTQSMEQDGFELKAATVGLPLPHMDLKIVDPLTGDAVGFGESGELLVRGHLVMKGYYNMPERTADAIDSEGWLHTGDLATMNPNGYVNIVGRVKDMIIRGGENIYPAEVESFLIRHPAVADAQVVGVPDSFMGEEGAALLRLKPGASCNEEEIREYCKATISRQKVPKYIMFIDAYPLTSSGKVKKFELRERLIKELGLEDGTRSQTA